jgi:hypothetical protein
VLKDQLRRGQARRQEGTVYKYEGDQIRNRAENRVVNFCKEEYRAVNRVSLGSWLTSSDKSKGGLTASGVCYVLCSKPASPLL